MSDGAPGFYMLGHGASLKDPYIAFELFHGKFSAGIGAIAGNNRLSRYKNPDYDMIIDAMAPLSSDDPKFKELAVGALEMYWSQQIDVPIIQWLHRIAYNQTYWTNWPTADNLAVGVNDVFWAQTGMLVITNLKATGKCTSSGQRTRVLGTRAFSSTRSEFNLSLKLIVKRLAFLITVIWAASKITFFIPRLSERNALSERFAELSRAGGFAPQDLEKITQSHSAQFG